MRSRNIGMAEALYNFRIERAKKLNAWLRLMQ